MSNVIRACERPVSGLFCEKFLFSIPPFQRPYGWTREQAGELLDDLDHAMQSNGGPATPYFLGTIVVIKEPDTPNSDVVDGQQRLATLTIILAVLRDLAETEDARQIDRYIKQEGKKFEGIHESFRLRLRDQDQPVFRKYVQAFGATRNLPESEEFDSDSAQRIIDNTDFLHDNLKLWSEEKRLRLLSYIVQQCFLVVVEATDREAAYRVFAVMNDRGLDLSPTDVLKAEIIGGIPADEREGYNSAWETYEEALGHEHFRELFSHIDTIFHRQKRRTSLEQAFRDHVLRFVNATDFITKYLEPLGECYLNLVECSYVSTEYAEDINWYLKQLWRLDYSDWRPVALAAMATFDKRPPDLLDALKRLERLAYGFFLTRTHANNRIARFCTVIDELMTHRELSRTRSAIDLTEAEAAAILQVLDGPVYTITRIRKVLLLRLDEALSDGTATYDHRTISVEHVLPQRPAEDSEWLEVFSDASVRQYWTHRLANLALLSRKKNSAAGNMEFWDKKQTYFARDDGASPFVLTSQIIAENEWTVPIMERRQKHLINRLAQLWELRTKSPPDWRLMLSQAEADEERPRLN
ncbi:MAG: DUF262 domain-containing protein [Hyphomicrobiaceae bacterium]